MTGLQGLPVQKGAVYLNKAARFVMQEQNNLVVLRVYSSQYCVVHLCSLYFRSKPNDLQETEKQRYQVRRLKYMYCYLI